MAARQILPWWLLGGGGWWWFSCMLPTPSSPGGCMWKCHQQVPPQHCGVREDSWPWCAWRWRAPAPASGPGLRPSSIILLIARHFKLLLIYHFAPGILTNNKSTVHFSRLGALVRSIQAWKEVFLKEEILPQGRAGSSLDSIKLTLQFWNWGNLRNSK